MAASGLSVRTPTDVRSCHACDTGLNRVSAFIGV